MEINFSKDISCEKCPLQFGNRSVMNMHMRLVHNIEAKSTNSEKAVKLENENCDQQASIESINVFSEQIVSVYEKNSSSDDKTYKCSICDLRKR